jgi:hypothetical protein
MRDLFFDRSTGQVAPLRRLGDEKTERLDDLQRLQRVGRTFLANPVSGVPRKPENLISETGNQECAIKGLGQGRRDWEEIDG